MTSQLLEKAACEDTEKISYLKLLSQFFTLIPYIPWANIPGIDFKAITEGEEFDTEDFKLLQNSLEPYQKNMLNSCGYHKLTPSMRYYFLKQLETLKDEDSLNNVFENIACIAKHQIHLELIFEDKKYFDRLKFVVCEAFFTLLMKLLRQENALAFKTEPSQPVVSSLL